MGKQIKINTKKSLSTKENSGPHKQKTGFRSQSSHVDRILHLQRTISNQDVQKLIRSGVLQAKLMVGQPKDKYEQEADRVAEAVIRMIEPDPLHQPRKFLQVRKPPIQSLEVAPDFETRINHLSGRGQPLPESVRAFFEPRFGCDFSRVRIHTDAQSSELARALNARAFTVGQDVVFGAEQYASGTAGGMQLLAHELTHVVQQQVHGVALIQRQCEKRGPPERELDEENPTSGLPPLVYKCSEAKKRGITEERRCKRPSVGYAQQLLNVFLKRYTGNDPNRIDCVPNADVDRIEKLRKQFSSPGNPQLKVDCWFGDDTHRATRMFQIYKGLEDDGKIGGNTWRALEAGTGEVPPPDVPPIPATPIAMPISSNNFWNNLNHGITAGNGVGYFNDGDVKYAAMNAPARMIVIHRTREEFFEVTVSRESKKYNCKAVINGNNYDVKVGGMMDAVMGHDPVEALHTIPKGHVVSRGKIVDGTSEPKRFYVVERAGPQKKYSDYFEFGFGDPPIGPGYGSAGLGGLGPVIINRLKFGDGNLYRQGVPPGAPIQGNPGPKYRPFLVQRNNNHYKDLAKKGKRTGKVVMAICRSADKMLLLVQPDGPPIGISLDDLRDKLAQVGVDDAVFLDGSDSAMLMINNKFHIRQEENKDELTTIGLGFV